MKSLEEYADKVAKSTFDTYENTGCKEVTSSIEGRFFTVCPVTKEIDFMWLKVEVVPNNLGQFIEYVTFSQWLESLKEIELGLEGSCNLIYEEVEKLISPNRLRVEVSTGYKFMNQKAVRTKDFDYGKPN